MTKEIGHHFLAKLGKKRLRPGGREATTWLIEQATFTKDSYVLEVACNRCTTAIELASTYKCHIIGLDKDPKVLDKANHTIKSANLTDYIRLQQGNALQLPFDSNSFDIVINEAMLTMLDTKAKEKAIREYYRVLKPGGILLTHDVTYTDKQVEALLSDLSRTINVKVAPLYCDDWINLFQTAGFTGITSKKGKMSLLSPIGMLRDEGLLGTVTIILNGLKKSNRQQFLDMFRFFNKTGKDLNYIVVASVK